jgi:glycerophosphoryl diester phosphodiesterase
MAHRGASGLAPENTMPSFTLGRDHGADVLEMDVHLSADEHVVVCHDPTVDRTTDGSGAIAGMTLAQLQALDAGYRFTADGGKTFPYRGQGIVIPTLAQVLDVFPQMPVNIEIKAKDERLVRQTAKLLNDHGRIEDGTVMLAAFDQDLTDLIRKLVPGALTVKSAREIGKFLALSHLHLTAWFSPVGDAIQPPIKKGLIRVVSRRFVKAAHRQGLEVHVWTVDDESEMRQLLDIGVDGLFTNFPGRLRKLVDEGSWA